jgi:hypothetical protein
MPSIYFKNKTIIANGIKRLTVKYSEDGEIEGFSNIIQLPEKIEVIPVTEPYRYEIKEDMPYSTIQPEISKISSFLPKDTDGQVLETVRNAINKITQPCVSYNYNKVATPQITPDFITLPEAVDPATVVMPQETYKCLNCGEPTDHPAKACSIKCGEEFSKKEVFIVKTNGRVKESNGKALQHFKEAKLNSAVEVEDEEIIQGIEKNRKEYIPKYKCPNCGSPGFETRKLSDYPNYEGLLDGEDETYYVCMMCSLPYSDESEILQK